MPLIKLMSVGDDASSIHLARQAVSDSLVAACFFCGEREEKVHGRRESDSLFTRSLLEYWREREREKRVNGNLIFLTLHSGGERGESERVTVHSEMWKRNCLTRNGEGWCSELFLQCISWHLTNISRREWWEVFTMNLQAVLTAGQVWETTVDMRANKSTYQREREREGEGEICCQVKHCFIRCRTTKCAIINIYLMHLCVCVCTCSPELMSILTINSFVCACCCVSSSSHLLISFGVAVFSTHVHCITLASESESERDTK